MIYIRDITAVEQVVALHPPCLAVVPAETETPVLEAAPKAPDGTGTRDIVYCLSNSDAYLTRTHKMESNTGSGDNSEHAG